MSARNPQLSAVARRYAGNAGWRQTRRAASTGLPVSVYQAAEAGMEDDADLLWASVCEVHHSLVLHSTLHLARVFAVTPEDWCEGCASVVALHERARAEARRLEADKAASRLAIYEQGQVRRAAAQLLRDAQDATS